MVQTLQAHKNAGSKIKEEDFEVVRRSKEGTLEKLPVNKCEAEPNAPDNPRKNTHGQFSRTRTQNKFFEKVRWKIQRKNDGATDCRKRG